MLRWHAHRVPTLVTSEHFYTREEEKNSSEGNQKFSKNIAYNINASIILVEKEFLTFHLDTKTRSIRDHPSRFEKSKPVEKR